MSDDKIPEVAPPAAALPFNVPISEVDESQLDLDKRAEEFFAPPTKNVSPVFVVAYLAAQFFFFIALLGPAILGVSLKAIDMFPGDNASQVSALSVITGLGALGAVFANVVFGQVSDRTMWTWGGAAPGSSSASSG